MAVANFSFAFFKICFLLAAGTQLRWGDAGLFSEYQVVAASGKSGDPRNSCNPVAMSDCQGEIELDTLNRCSSQVSDGTAKLFMAGIAVTACVRCPGQAVINLNEYPYFRCNNKPLCPQLAGAAIPVELGPKQQACMFLNKNNAHLCLTCQNGQLQNGISVVEANPDEDKANVFSASLSVQPVAAGNSPKAISTRATVSDPAPEQLNGFFPNVTVTTKTNSSYRLSSKIHTAIVLALASILASALLL